MWAGSIENTWLTLPSRFRRRRARALLPNTARIAVECRLPERGIGCRFQLAATPAQFAPEYQSLADRWTALVISTRWLEKRKPYWKRLENLLDRRARTGFKSLTRAELQELGLLYRQIAADLAALREDRGSINFATYLNQLLVRAHNTIYSARKA